MSDLDYEATVALFPGFLFSFFSLYILKISCFEFFFVASVYCTMIEFSVKENWEPGNETEASDDYKHDSLELCTH